MLLINTITRHKNNTIKMKPIDVNSDSYAEYNEDSNVTKPKFKVGDDVRISKYKNIFAKGYTQNWLEGFYFVSKIRDKVPWIYVISDLYGEPITGSFYGKELQKTNQKEVRIEKVLKRNVDKLYAEWKGYDDLFNSWIDKKDLERNCLI